MSARRFQAYDPVERDEAVLNAWAEGKSFSQVAMCVPGVLTRSTVSGIIHRARERGDPRAERRAAPKANGPKPLSAEAAQKRREREAAGAERRAQREAARRTSYERNFAETRHMQHDRDKAERRAKQAASQFQFVRYKPPRITDDGLEGGRAYNPATDPKPDFLRWSR